MNIKNENKTKSRSSSGFSSEFSDGILESKPNWDFKYRNGSLNRFTQSDNGACTGACLRSVDDYFGV